MHYNKPSLSTLILPVPQYQYNEVSKTYQEDLEIENVTAFPELG